MFLSGLAGIPTLCAVLRASATTFPCGLRLWLRLLGRVVVGSAPLHGSSGSLAYSDEHSIF